MHVIEEKAQVGDTFTWDAVGKGSVGWSGVGCGGGALKAWHPKLLP